MFGALDGEWIQHGVNYCNMVDYSVTEISAPLVATPSRMASSTAHESGLEITMDLLAGRSFSHQVRG